MIAWRSGAAQRTVRESRPPLRAMAVLPSSGKVRLATACRKAAANCSAGRHIERARIRVDADGRPNRTAAYADSFGPRRFSLGNDGKGPEYSASGGIEAGDHAPASSFSA